ncbi:MAG: ABC transporter ATP-binding protein [Planctomycetota bacterium]
MAVDSLDLEVVAGEFIAVTGPSGSGKSTLLNLMGAMDRPTKGEVSIDGELLANAAIMERVRSRKIGFVFQMHNLIPVLTAKQNVVVPLWPHRVSKAERRERATDLLTRVGLADRIDTNVKVLSGGERQRVALARALVTNPRLLLADEPTGNLDTTTGFEVMELMHAMRRQVGSALVLVTHDESICQGADRRFQMRDGRLEQTA